MQDLKKDEIIAKLQAAGIDVNPALTKAELIKMLPTNAVNAITTGDPIMPQVSIVPPSVTPVPSQDANMAKLMEMMGTMINKLDSVEKRVSVVEGGDKNAFKSEPKTEDILRADKGKESLDPKIVKIVEETLGMDFGLEVTGYTDKPGLLFTILVPQRLSSVPVTSKPRTTAENVREYEKDKYGNVIEDEYWPGDRRSRAIGSTQSYDVIQDHCNRIRSYIVAWYAKTNRPLPEFKLK